MIGDIKYGELQCTNPSVSMASEINSTEAAIKYTSTLETTGYIWRIGKQTAELMDWSKHYYKLWLIENGDPQSLGIYIPQSVEKETDGATLYKITGYDKSILAKNDCITSRLSLAAGTKYLDQITSLLISCGITMVIADDSTATLQTTRDDWDIGTSKLKIINQLLSEISFRSVEMDKNGAAVLKRYEDASAGNIQHTYREGQASIVENDTTISSNLLEIPNIWIATVSNPDLSAALTYKYVNDNPLSATSTAYTGQNKVKVLNFDSIATQTDLETAVKKQAFSDMQGIETVEFKTAVVADHGANDVVALELPQFNGILTETAWEINLDAMTMSHTGKESVNYG
jgi:hypothetical protein